MVLPNRYNLASEGVLANYNYTDLDEGVGYVVYNALKATDEFLLSKSVMFSNLIISSGSKAGIFVATKVIDIDFDITFNTPKVVRGTAFFTFTQAVSDGSRSSDVYFIIKIRKWDGSSETEIANNQSDTVSVSSSEANKTECVEVDISETNFKSGETLRITMEGYLTRTGSATGTGSICYIGHDPKDRVSDVGSAMDGADTTQLTCLIPYKLQL